MEEKTVFDATIFDNYIMKLNEYDFVLFDSHGSGNAMALGIPSVLDEDCKDSKYDKECKILSSQCTHFTCDEGRPIGTGV